MDRSRKSIRITPLALASAGTLQRRLGSSFRPKSVDFIYAAKFTVKNAKTVLRAESALEKQPDVITPRPINPTEKGKAVFSSLQPGGLLH